MPINVLSVLGAADKKRNTATMLKSSFDGALSVPGAAGEAVCLHDIAFHGCSGCHSCKLLDERFFARCAMRDGLTPILEKAIAADVLLIGSPARTSIIGVCCLQRVSANTTLKALRGKHLQLFKLQKAGCWIRGAHAKEARAR